VWWVGEVVLLRGVVPGRYLDTPPHASSSRELLGLQASLSAPSCSDNMLCDFSNQTNLRWVSDKSDENPSKFGTVLDC